MVNTRYWTQSRWAVSTSRASENKPHRGRDRPSDNQPDMLAARCTFSTPVGGQREKGGLCNQQPLLSPEPEPELETAPDRVARIPEPPTPDMPVWDIGGFTLLEGRLVLLGEEEVRKRKERGGNWAER